MSQPPVARPPKAVTRPPKAVTRKPNGSRHGTPPPPSNEELGQRIAWLHDLVKTNPGISVTALRDAVLDEYDVSARTAYRYIDKAGLTPRDTDGDTARAMAGDTDDDTARDTDSDTPDGTDGDTPDGTARDTTSDTAKDAT